MNVIYYVLGAIFTFVGQVVYSYFRNGGQVVLNSQSVTQLFIVSAIAGISFFLADYLMSRVSKS
jgi:frataxin-like iron-binding protein CyaY